MSNDVSSAAFDSSGTRGGALARAIAPLGFLSSAAKGLRNEDQRAICAAFQNECSTVKQGLVEFWMGSAQPCESLPTVPASCAMPSADDVRTAAALSELILWNS
jgi:hypothetical protein